MQFYTDQEEANPLTKSPEWGLTDDSLLGHKFIVWPSANPWTLCCSSHWLWCECFGGTGCDRSYTWLWCLWSRPCRPSLSAVLCFIKKGQRVSRNTQRAQSWQWGKYLFVLKRAVFFGPFQGRFCSNASCKERCCEVVICHPWRIYRPWSQMDPWSECQEMSTKCSHRSFVNLQRRTRSEICISTSLDKAAEANGPCPTIPTCIWPENTKRAKTCKKPKQPNPKTNPKNQTTCTGCLSVYQSQCSKNYR